MYDLVEIKMVSSASRVIKLSKNLKPFVSRVVRSGAVQLAFKEQIGRPVGQCVAGQVRAGMSGAEIHRVAYQCSRSAVGTKLDVAGARSRIKGKAYAEYTEIV